MQTTHTEQHDPDGFSLIELLVVIVILGILAAVVVFAVGGSTTSAQEKSCDAIARAYHTAIEAWYAQDVVVDNGVIGHPSGQDIEDTGLVRPYIDDQAIILEPGTPGHNGSSRSTVAAVAGGNCDGYLVQS
jgi:prepilin-type N-terminal cleavage/methylation domain-containing protein